ncbi:MAG: ribosomal protein S18-alanine N-acetyltransferase [Casimicrobiaceae bacterium]
MASIRLPSRKAVAWRPMAEADVGYVAALEANIHLAAWTAGNFRDALAAGYSMRVGEREGRIVAYGVLMLAPGEAQLLNLSVVHDARREGLGAALLDLFIVDARRLGAEQVFLEVRVSNVAAITLYERAGFARVGRRNGYYPGGPTPEDALVMRRAIGVPGIRGV